MFELWDVLLLMTPKDLDERKNLAHQFDDLLLFSDSFNLRVSQVSVLAIACKN